MVRDSHKFVNFVVKCDIKEANCEQYCTSYEFFLCESYVNTNIEGFYFAIVLLGLLARKCFVKCNILLLLLYCL